jgi:hypothetical protein
LLVTALLNTGAYQDGRLLVIAPAANTDCQTAITRYRTELISEDPAETRFQGRPSKISSLRSAAPVPTRSPAG